MKSAAFLHHIYDCFMNMKLKQKLLTGYFFIVIIPVFTVSILMFSFNYRASQKAYLKSQEQEMNNFGSQFDSLLEQIAHYSYFFQNNTDILAYLGGQYTTPSDVLFHYMDTISETFDCASSDTRVIRMKVFSLQDQALFIPAKLENIDNFPYNRALINTVKKHPNGYWFWSHQGSLTYYQPLYNQNYQNALGILQIETNPAQILQSLIRDLNYSWYFRFSSFPEQLFTYQEQKLRLCNAQEQEEFLTSGSGYLTKTLDTLSGQLLQPVIHSDYLRSHIFLYILLTLIVLFLFSLLYFSITQSLTHRLVDFNKFISGQLPRELKEYPGILYQDEIGNTILAYNHLIQQINTLIHDNYEVSLKMKEARYYALQSQIQPHFLYNILENIRMSSVSHRDMETAQMTAVFGKYLRYSMNTSMDAEPLEKELQSARDYLDVNKIRLGSSLTYEISVEAELDDVYCPRFILQPLLENSVKHGLIKGKTLHISLRIFGEDSSEMSPVLCVQIQDDGAGIQPELLHIIQDILYSKEIFPSSRHVGLRNVNDRLKAFHPDHQGLRIECPECGGTIIEFSLIRKNNVLP